MNEFAMSIPLHFALNKDGGTSDNNRETAILFNTLFISEKKALYNFILKSVNFSEDANDIYQDTVLRALKYFKKFDPLRKFKPWLFAIAVNEIRKYFKARGEHNGTDSIEQIFEQIPDGRDKKLKEAVFSVAYSLNTIERDIFFLFYDSGFSVSEISEITGKNGGNIKVILSNSRKKIRSLLGYKNEK